MRSPAATRRTIIDLALKHRKPGSGSTRATHRRRTARLIFPDLRAVLGSIPWAVIGAGATRLYMQERETDDLDILISSEHAQRLAGELTEAGFVRRGDLSIGGSSWITGDGFPVDVVESSADWCPAALAEASSNLDLQGLPVLPLAYLVLMKYQASRLVDFGDLGKMLGQATNSQLDAVREVFRQHAPGEKEDLESLIMLGKLEADSA